MQFPITIGLHRSLLLQRISLLLGALAGLGLGFLPLDWQMRLPLQLLTLALTAWSWRELGRACPALRLERDGRVLLRQPLNEEFVAAELLPGASVHHWLTVLRVKTETGRRYTLVATVDNLSRVDFRRLRIFLRARANFTGGHAADVV